MQKLTETLSALRSRFYSGALKAERSCTGRLAELDAAKVRYGAWQDARHACGLGGLRYDKAARKGLTA